MEKQKSNIDKLREDWEILKPFGIQKEFSSWFMRETCEAILKDEKERRDGELRFLEMLENIHSTKERLEAIRMRINYIKNILKVNEVEDE